MGETIIADGEELLECPDCGAESLSWDGSPEQYDAGKMAVEIYCVEEGCSFAGCEYWEIDRTVRYDD